MRLPTEAEWEYACRAGSKTPFCYGDDASQLGQYAWYSGNAGDQGEKYAHAVGQKQPNAWGLRDMHGNVFEWCQDWYADSYARTDVRDPKGPASGKYPVLRGGSWRNPALHCLAAKRNRVDPDHRGSDIGFRVVVQVE